MKWGQNKQNRTLWWRQARSISKAHEMMFACCSHSFIKFSVQDFKTWRLGSLSNAARMIFLLGSLKLLETWTGTKLWRAAKAFGTTCRSTHHATYKILFAHCFFLHSAPPPLVRGCGLGWLEKTCPSNILVLVNCLGWDVLVIKCPLYIFST